jgi:D-glycerate 3-kinase
MLQHLVSRCDDGQARLPLLALNGPVGAGKSSLGRVLEALAPAFGLRLVVASIDDLYLPWPERQRRLAGNPFAVSRVPPGSHDLDLLLDALIRWRQGGELRLPRFDKTLVQGQGDRCGWHQGPCDALVLEGWLMGCQALGAKGLAQALGTFDLSRPGPGGAPALEPIELEWLPYWDRQLAAYGPLWQACDGLWLLRPLNWALPRRWRFQAEARQRRSGGGWLSAAELERLVRSSLCSLPPQLYQDPLGADPDLVMADQPSINGAPEGAGVGGLGHLCGPGGPQGHQGQARQGFDDQAAAEPLGLQVVVNSPAPAGSEGPKAAERVRRDQAYIQEVPTTTAGSQPVGGRHLAGSEATLGSAMVQARAGLTPAAKIGLRVQGLAVLDGRRRCVAILGRRTLAQDSLSASSSLIG